MFESVAKPPADALHGVMARYRADPRLHKIDLGVGVYRDESGASPVMRAVKAAEAALVADEDSKAYLGLHGDEAFLAAMTELVFGADHPAVRAGRMAAIQGTGGTGALRIALDLARGANPGLRLHIGLPTWPNHVALAAAAGIHVAEHRYFDIAAQRIDHDAIAAAAASTRRGDLFLFHGPCHNPTGEDLTGDERAALLRELVGRGAVPLIDAAYYGLGDGLDADLAILRKLATTAERALVAVACSKSFGLYRERTGILFILCADAAERERVHGEVARISRTLVSMPPAHGAATVARILTDPALHADWKAELAEMRSRIIGLRAELAACATVSPMLAGIDRQRGIFRMLPLRPEQIEALAADHAIHLAPSGRANLAGLKDGDSGRLAEALAAVAPSG